MAKRVVKWVLNGSIMSLLKPSEDPKGDAVLQADFDLTKLFSNFAQMTEIQQQIIGYGIKQKLMDTGASEIADVEGKVSRAKAKFSELIAGKWSGDRVNSTGAAENKRIVSEVKKSAEVVSLQGLMMKKIAFPDKFTPEDEKKLQEFMAIYAKQQ